MSESKENANFVDRLLYDARVWLIPKDDFFSFCILLAIAYREGKDGVLPPPETIAFLLRIQASDVPPILDRLAVSTLIDKLPGGSNGYRFAINRFEEWIR